MKGGTNGSFQVAGMSVDNMLKVFAMHILLGKIETETKSPCKG